MLQLNLPKRMWLNENIHKVLQKQNYQVEMHLCPKWLYGNISKCSTIKYQNTKCLKNTSELIKLTKSRWVHSRTQSSFGTGKSRTQRLKPKYNATLLSFSPLGTSLSSCFVPGTDQYKSTCGLRLFLTCTGKSFLIVGTLSLCAPKVTALDSSRVTQMLPLHQGNGRQPRSAIRSLPIVSMCL